MGGYETILRRLAIRDDAYVESLLADTGANERASRLDPKTHALVRVAALIAMDAAPPSYLSAVERALARGATLDEIVGTLVAVMPAVGWSRVVSAAPNLGLAVGYDVAAALEQRAEESARTPDQRASANGA